MEEGRETEQLYYCRISCEEMIKPHIGFKSGDKWKIKLKPDGGISSPIHSINQIDECK